MTASDWMRNVLWAAAEAAKGNMRRKYHVASASQWLDSGDAAAIQRERIVRLLEHAVANVPYYRKTIGSLDGIHTAGTFEGRFSEVPFLDKATIKNHYVDLQSEDLASRKWSENTSGGSTGQPVRFIQDSEYREWNRAIKILFDSWTGYSIGQRKVGLWGSERDLWVGKETYPKRLRDWVRNEVWLNTFRMTRDQSLSYVQVINRIRPCQITSYVESAYDMARLIEREGLQVHSPDSILTTGGTLYPEMRDRIESVFGARVFNRYGSREVGDIACECEYHTGLHVASPSVYVELVDSAGRKVEPGGSGEVVVTLLTNWAMPLIRYRIGDTATWSDQPCPCGRAWPILEKVTGRTIDIFITADGAKVHAQYFIHLFYFHDWVEKFQVTQHEPDLIEILIVPRGSAADPLVRYRKFTDDITAKVRLAMGPTCRVVYKFTGEIPPSPSGKYRYTISNVAEPCARDRNLKT